MDRRDINLGKERVAGRWSGALAAAVFYCAYVVSGGFSEGLVLVPGTTVRFWPPAGIFLGALLLSEPRRWWHLVWAGLAAELTCNAAWFGNAWHWAAAYYAANALESTTAAWLIRMAVKRKFRLETLEEAAALVLIGGMIAPVVGATIIAGIDAVTGKSEFWLTWGMAWLGDGTGAVVFTPMTVAVVAIWRDRAELGWWRVSEGVVIAGLLAGTCDLALRGYLPTIYMTMPALLWAAARFQLIGAATAISLVTVMTAVEAAQGGTIARGAGGGVQEQMVQLQTYLAVAATTALFVGAVAQEQLKALRKVREVNESLEEKVWERSVGLWESEGKLRLFIEHVPAAAAMLDREMRYLAASKRWMSDFGLEGQDIRGRSHYEVFPEISEEWKRVHVRALAGEGARSDGERFVRANGRVQWLKWEVLPWLTGEGAVGGVMIASEDITAQRETNEQLRLSEERFRQAASALRAIIYEVALEDGTWTADAFGLEQMLGTDVGGAALTQEWWTKRVHTEDANKLREFLRQCVRSAECTEYSTEYRVRHKNGEYRDVMDTARVFRDERGRAVRIVGTILDVTERKSLEKMLAQHAEEVERRLDQRTKELLATNEQLRRSESMAILGMLSTGISHDLGNLLLPMRMRMEALEDLALPDAARKEVEAIKKGISYLDELARRLRISARGRGSEHGEGLQETVDLRRWKRDVELFLAKMVTATAEYELKWEIEDGLPALRVNKSGLTQAIYNLVQNAVKAMRRSGCGTKVRVSARRGREGEVKVAVEDDGPGMSEEVRARCMEPRFTTHSEEGGTGMGLALVKAFAEQHGGKIEVTSPRRDVECGGTRVEMVFGERDTVRVGLNRSA